MPQPDAAAHNAPQQRRRQVPRKFLGEAEFGMPTAAFVLAAEDMPFGDIVVKPEE